jgi:nucleoside-diphosphate-sugar epimerase
MDPQKETVIVTGSSGLISEAVINRFAGRFNLVGFDREGPPHPPPFAECICVDFASDKSVQAALRRVREGYGERIASVIHLAAYYDFSGEPSPNYEQITVRGTEHLLRGLHAFDVEQFIFSSTLLVHAPTTPGRPINEEWPLEPKWDYPKSKVEAENVIRAQHGNIPAVLLRIASVYDDRCHSPFLAHQIQRIYERQLIAQFYPDDIKRGQPFVHLDDLLDALVLLIERRAKLPKELTLLLGEPETLSYDELQRELGQLLHGEAWETREIPKPLAKTGAWVQDKMEDLIPDIIDKGEEPFIKPFMVDLADDHYELDIPGRGPGSAGSRSTRSVRRYPRWSTR